MKALTISVIVLLAAGVCLTQFGCASMAASSLHDARVDAAQALKFAAGADGKSAYVGLDLLQAKGYFAAWREEPGLMAGATGVDALLGLGVYLGAKNMQGGGDDNSSTTTINVNGNQNNTTTGGRDTSGSHTTTTTN